VVCFLCSDEAAYITGAQVPVDGGRAIWSYWTEGTGEYGGSWYVEKITEVIVGHQMDYVLSRIYSNVAQKSISIVLCSSFYPVGKISRLAGRDYSKPCQFKDRAWGLDPRTGNDISTTARYLFILFILRLRGLPFGSILSGVTVIVCIYKPNGTEYFLCHIQSALANCSRSVGIFRMQFAREAI
jgi:hypothetical protein